MKTPFLLSIIFLSVSSFAEIIRFRTINEARAAGPMKAVCFTRNGSPEVTFTFTQSIDPYAATLATLAMVQPQEGIYVRDWNPIGGTPVPPTTWTLSPTLGDLTITGQWFGTPFNESIKVFMKDATNGRFDGTLEYANYSTNVRVVRNVRCYLQSGKWTP